MIRNNAYITIIEEYCTYLRTLGYSTSIIKNHPNAVRDLLVYLEEKGWTTLQRINTTIIFEYYHYLESRPHKKNPSNLLAVNSINNHYKAIDSFLTFLHQIGLENAPPPTNYRLEPQAKKNIHVLTQLEIKQLYEATNKAYAHLPFTRREPRRKLTKLTLDLCYGCGLRRSEAANVRLKDIDFDRKLIYVRQGKNYKDRYVPMSQKVYQNIQTFVYHYRNRITTKRKTYLYPYSNSCIQRDLAEIINHCSEKIRVKKPTLHTLRHSIATHLLQNGMNIENISTFLGHSGLTSTQLYTHIINDLEDEL